MKLDIVERLRHRAENDRKIQANNEAVATALRGQRLLFDQGVRSAANTFAVRLALDYENCAKSDASLAADWEEAADTIAALRAELAAVLAREADECRRHDAKLDAAEAEVARLTAERDEALRDLATPNRHAYKVGVAFGRSQEAARADAAFAAGVEAAAKVAEEEGWPLDKAFHATAHQEGAMDCAERIATAIRALAAPATTAHPYALSDALQKVVDAQMSAPSWDTERDRMKHRPTPVAAALAVPEVRALVKAASAMKEAVEGIQGAMEYGTWRAERSNLRMKDTDEWVSFYNALAALKGDTDDPPCTDCGGSGVTFQTERPCACSPSTPTPLAAALAERDALRAEVARLTAEMAAGSFYKESDIDALQARADAAFAAGVEAAVAALEALPRRPEKLGGQTYSYVRLEEVATAIRALAAPVKGGE